MNYSNSGMNPSLIHGSIFGGHMYMNQRRNANPYLMHMNQMLNNLAHSNRLTNTSYLYTTMNPTRSTVPVPSIPMMNVGLLHHAQHDVSGDHEQEPRPQKRKLTNKTDSDKDKKKKKKRPKKEFFNLSEVPRFDLDGIPRKTYDSITAPVDEHPAVPNDATASTASVGTLTMTASNENDSGLGTTPTLTTVLQTVIDKTTKFLENRKTPLLFTLYEVDGTEVKDCDIFTYSSNITNSSNTYGKDFNLYFSKESFPIEKGWKGEGWKKLWLHVKTVAGKNGVRLIIKRTKPKQNLSIIGCQKSKVTTSKRKENLSDVVFRKFSKSHNAMNNRGPKGKRLSRKSKIDRASSKECVCGFYFKIGLNDKGFHVKPKTSCNTHSGHIVLSNNEKAYIPTHCIPVDTQDLGEKMSSSGLRTDSVGAVLFNDTGTTMDRNALRYHTKTKIFSFSGNKKKLYSTDNIFEMIEQKKLPYITLTSNYVDSSENLNLISNKDGFYEEGEKKDSTATYSIVNDEEGVDDAIDYIRNKWKVLKLRKDQCLLVAFVWTTPFQKKLFDANPEVIFMDTTKDTNNEKRPLLTMTGRRASTGKMFHILHAFLPHECGWIFDWILQEVMTSLFKKETLLKTKIIFSDGDSQEIDAIEDGIELIFKNAIRGRCGWHIIDRGWLRRGPSYPPRENKEERKKFQQQEAILKKWFYSWCKPTCETVGEFKISYFLLIKYIESKKLEKNMGSLFVKQIQEFVRNYLHGSLSNMLYYKKKGRRHYHMYSSVVHEGTNRQIKHGALACNKTDSLYESTKKLIQGQEIKQQKTYTDICNKVGKSNNWSDMKISDDLTEYGFESLKQEYDAAKDYVNVRSDILTFLVTMKRDLLEARSKSIHPVFDKVRTVSYNPRTKVFKCSCCLFEDFGLVCRHILNIFLSLPIPHEINKHDISCAYWKLHEYFQLVDHKQNEYLNKVYEKLRDNDIEGPTCPENLFLCVPITNNNELPSYFKTKGSVCLNYNLNKVKSTDIEEAFKPTGLTQTVHSQYDDKDNKDDSTGILQDYEDTNYDLITDGLTQESIDILRSALSEEYSEDYTSQNQDIVCDDIHEQVQENVELCSQDITTSILESKNRSAYSKLKNSYEDIATFVDQCNNSDVTKRADVLLKQVKTQLEVEYSHLFDNSRDSNSKLVSTNVTSLSNSRKQTKAREWIGNNK